MNILVTGATGFIGRHLIRHLIVNGEHTVFGLTRKAKKAAVKDPSGVRYLPADITSPESLHNLRLPHLDIVYHCAAYVDNKPEEVLYDTNVRGTENVCEFALRRGVSRLIYTSSVAVVSGHDRVPLTEDMPYKATNPYGFSKIEAEKIVRGYREKGLFAVILRPPMVYGEDEPHLLGLLLKLLRWRVLPFLNGGNQAFHVAYVENVVAGMLYALEGEELLRDTYFIADEDVFSYKEVVGFLCEGLGVGVPWRVPRSITRALDVIPLVKRKRSLLLKPRCYCLDRIRSLGFNAPFTARESLIETARNFHK